MPRTSTILAWSVAASTVISAAASAPPARIRGVDGRWMTPFRPAGPANVLFFVSTDCPISNSYVPEIQRLCAAYTRNAVACSLVYEDLQADSSAVRRHLAEFQYRDMAAAIDRDRTIARAARAAVTPQAVVIDNSGTIRYRGRIDDRYAGFGKPRRHVTTHDLADALEAVLHGRTVAVTETETLGCAIPQ